MEDYALLRKGIGNNMEKPSFLKNHADTVAIMGLNLAIAGILIALYISNVSNISSVNARMDAANSRMDTLHVMFYDLLKEGKK